MKDGERVWLDRTAHRPLYRMFAPDRCFTCTDFGNELADISVADCWERGQHGDEYKYPKGAAWIIARTQRGQDFLKMAVDRGYLKFHETALDVNDQRWSQSFLHRKVRAFNRIHLMRENGILVPQFDHPIPPLNADYLKSDRTDLAFRSVFKNDRLRRYFLKWWAFLYREKSGSISLAIRNYLGLYAFSHRNVLKQPLRVGVEVILLSLREVAKRLFRAVR
jgi:hypothetical protein